MKAVILTLSDWETKIKPELVKEYGVKIYISWVMKRELGFTVRYHQQRAVGSGTDLYYAFAKEVHLDFYDEAMRTMFLLKFC